MLKKLKDLSPTQLLQTSLYTLMGGLALLAFSNHIKQHVTMLPLYKPTTGPYFYLYKYVSVYLQAFIQVLSEYIPAGVIVIIVTIVVKMLLTPVTLYTSRYLIINQSHKKAISPQTNLVDDALRFEIVNQKQRKQLISLKNKVIKDNDAKTHSWPLIVNIIVQIIVLAILYQIVAYTDVLKHATFLSFKLGQPSSFLAICACASYVLSGFISGHGMKKEGTTPPHTIYWLGPVSIFTSAYFLPSILAIYWLTSGLYNAGENYIKYFIWRPRMRKKQQKWQPKQIITNETIEKILGR